MKEIKLRRSYSEKKLGKEKKKERGQNSRSVHFDNPGTGTGRNRITFFTFLLTIS